MSKYRITLDGKVYEMEVELIDEGRNQGENRAADLSNQPAVSSSSKSDVRVIDPSVHTETHVSENTVLSPMPGTVTAVLVGPGDTVAKGQTVLVLEAMKMENDITAPADGTLGRLFVESGQSVQGGVPLFELA